MTLSTCESEYYAITLAAQETIWVRRVMNEAALGIDGAVPIRSENQSAIEWETEERCPSSHAKHTDVRVRSIRNLAKKENIAVLYVPSEINDADVLTNPLGPQLLSTVF